MWDEDLKTSQNLIYFRNTSLALYQVIMYVLKFNAPYTSNS